MKRKEGPHGLRVDPTFEEAIQAKPKQVTLRKFPRTTLWDSLAFQSLLGLRDAIETEQELEAKRAQMNVLMARVAKEYGAPMSHVRAVAKEWGKAGLFEMDVDDDDPTMAWYNDDLPPPPPGGGAVAARRLAPYAAMTGEDANAVANVILDMMQKGAPARERKEREAMARMDAEKRIENDESGAARIPPKVQRLMKYGKFLRKKIDERAKAVKVTPGRRSEKVTPGRRSEKVTPGRRSARV